MSPIRKRLSQYAMFSGRTKGSSETPMTHLGSKGFGGVGLGVYTGSLGFERVYSSGLRFRVLGL